VPKSTLVESALWLTTSPHGSNISLTDQEPVKKQCSIKSEIYLRWPFLKISKTFSGIMTATPKQLTVKKPARL